MSGINRERLETLVLARSSTLPQKPRRVSLEQLASGLQSYAPLATGTPEWRALVGDAVQRLRDRGLVDPHDRPVSPAFTDELQRRIGPHTAKRWQQWSDRILPGLALEIAPSDARTAKRLDGRDGWCAAIAGRLLGLWNDGTPPTLGQLCDALVARELGLPSIAKCPAMIRAHFLRKQVAADATAPDQLVRQLATRAVGASNAGLSAIYAGLIRSWLAGRSLRVSLVEAVRAAAQHASEGVFGDRKVFIASVWNAIRASPPWSAIPLDDFKARLVAAHRNQELVLARADLVAAMDPALVASSETRTDGATFHFVVREQSP